MFKTSLTAGAKRSSLEAEGGLAAYISPRSTTPPFVYGYILRRGGGGRKKEKEEGRHIVIDRDNLTKRLSNEQEQIERKMVKQTGRKAERQRMPSKDSLTNIYKHRQREGE